MMKQSIFAPSWNFLLFLVSLLLGATTTWAQAVTPKAELDQAPYLSSCKDATTANQQSCSYQALLTYVGEHLSYPKEAYASKAEGMVVLEFVVGTNGKIKEGKILKSSDNTTLDKAALALLEGMKKDQQWQPGIKNGQAVNTSLKLPVKFKLN